MAETAKSLLRMRILLIPLLVEFCGGVDELLVRDRLSDTTMYTGSRRARKRSLSTFV
jgi:hypothetical protein